MSLERLGLPSDARAVIVHVDDVGMCHASIPAAQQIMAAGTATSLSVMVPCPWARIAVEELAGADVGVHWTLTSEWPRYRWSSLTGALDLHDDEGRLPRTCEEIWQRGSAESVGGEVAAQLDQARQWGPISHADSHMGSLARVDWLPVAVASALERGLVPFVPNLPVEVWQHRGLSPDAAQAAVDWVASLAEAGVPLVDHVRAMPLDHADDHRGDLLRTLEELPAGITHLYCHPAIDTPELRAICPDWPARVENFAALTSPGMREAMEATGVTLIRYADLQALLG